MPIEDKNDKQILDLLENDYPTKMIEVDFKDLNNKNLIIRNSFIESYKKLNDFNGKWFFVIQLGINAINVIGLVNLDLTDSYVNLNYLEINKIFKKQKRSTEIIIYLKKFSDFRHLKGIRVKQCEMNNFFIKHGFKKEGNFLILS